MINDIQVTDFTPHIEAIDKKELPMITIYDTTTSDYPGQYVARLLKVMNGQVYFSNIVAVNKDIRIVKAAIPINMIKVSRSESDDRCIIESYF